MLVVAVAMLPFQRSCLAVAVAVAAAPLVQQQARPTR